MMHAIAAKAVALREASGPSFRAYARQVVDNARALAVALATAGMRPVSGGTDTHLVLADIRELGITGRDAEARCDLARITLNKNAIPFDPQRPAVTSGIRVGSPGVTTQGMREGEMRLIGRLIGAALRSDPDTSAGSSRLADVADEVVALTGRFPAYARQEVMA